jgi:hypothetical protein
MYICTKFGQNPLKDVDSRVFTRMLRKDGSVTISLRNFVGEGIISGRLLMMNTKCTVFTLIWVLKNNENI